MPSESGVSPHFASAKASAGAAAGDAGGSHPDAVPRVGGSTEVCRQLHGNHHQQAVSPTVDASSQQQQQQQLLLPVLPLAAAPANANQQALPLPPVQMYSERRSPPSAAASPPAPTLLLSQPPMPADADQMVSPDVSTDGSPWLTYVASAAKAPAGGTVPASTDPLQPGQQAAEAELLTPPAPLVPQFAAAQVTTGTWSAGPSLRSYHCGARFCCQRQHSMVNRPVSSDVPAMGCVYKHGVHVATFLGACCTIRPDCKLFKLHLCR